MRVRTAPIPLNQMQVTVHTEYGQYPTSQKTRYVSADSQGRYKAHEVCLNGDEECHLEK
jgi:hypothetical protein